MGAAEHPDIDNYYDESCEFPLTYSPEEDPEVIKEMRVTAAELERGENNSEGKDDSDEFDESLASWGSSGKDNRPEEGWDDVDDEDGLASTGNWLKSTKGTKLMLTIDKVHTMDFFESFQPS